MDRLMQYIGIGWIIAAAGTLVANTGVEEGEQGGMGEWVGTLVITAIVAVVLYMILRRMTLSSTTGLVLAIIAVVTVGLFWSGLPPIFAAASAAAALPRSGIGGQGANTRDTKSVVAVALAALAVLAFLVLVFIG